MATPYPGNDDWPSHFDAGTVQGRFVGLGGTPRTGYCTFTPSPEVFSLVDDEVIVVPEVIVGPQLDEHGFFTLDLPGTDDPDVSPKRWTYHVVEVWDGGRQYDIKVPVGETVGLSAGSPIPNSLGVPRYVGPKGDTGDVGPRGPQGIAGTADLGPVTLNNTGVADGKVPMAQSGTTGDWEYPLGVPLSGTPAPMEWLRSTDSGHAAWSPMDPYNSTGFSSDTTYTSPVGVRGLWVMVNGAGGGGGSGARGNGTPGGGSGGGGGGLTLTLIRAGHFNLYGTDNLDGTFTFPVNVGNGGVGGVAASADNSPGSGGGDGDYSSFGAGAYAICASGGLGGKAGGTTSGTVGGFGGSGTTDGGDGGKSDTALGATAPRLSGGASGGGAGGSIDGLGISHNGGNANYPSVSQARTGAGAGGVPTGGSASGSDGSGTLIFHPGLGGGGGASTSSTGGHGGNGGAGGGGAGGGGASGNGHASGAGGTGGVGRVVVVELY